MKNWNDWNNPARLVKQNPDKYPLAQPRPPVLDRGPLPGRVIVVWGDGQFPTVPGNPAAPSCSIFTKLKQTSRMLGKFPAGHALEGQQRLIVLKVNENYSSQIPSCWSSGAADHPDIINVLPAADEKLSSVDAIWSVKQCPHCHKVWNRDVNACRNIGIIFESLRDNRVRPGIYGPPKEGEVDLI